MICLSYASIFLEVSQPRQSCCPPCSIHRGLVFKFGRTEDLWQWRPLPRSTATLPGIGFSSPLTQSFVTLFSKLISEYNLSLKLYDARIMSAPVHSATVWCAATRPAFAMGKETIDVSNFVSCYHGLKSRLWRSGRVLGVRVRSGIQSVCLLSSPSSESDVE